MLRFRMLPGAREKGFETEDGMRRGKNNMTPVMQKSSTEECQEIYCSIIGY